MGRPTRSSLPPGELERSDTLADQAYRAIREHIATGHLAQGERITERSLAVLLGVSPTPIREAIRSLQQDGLVERRGPREVVVVEHSPAALRELSYVEVALRAAQARIAAAKIDSKTLDELDAVVDELEAKFESNTPQAQLEIAHRFDQLLVATAENRTLENLISTVSIFGQQIRERSLVSMRRDPEVAVHLKRLQDHRDIVAALRAGDPEQVESVVRRHLLSVIDYLLHQADREPTTPNAG